MRRVNTLLLCGACALMPRVASAQLSVVVQDISPDRSTNTNPNGASGGRVNGLAVDRTTPARIYAASEFGGLWRSTNNGQNWQHLDGHVPTVTSDVEVDPTNSNRIYATSFYDGRTNSRSGINVSTDGGTTWTHPATATPPANFCENVVRVNRRTEPAAFAIAIDPANSNRVFVGSNCGLAISSDAGVTWTFVDPTPGDPADDVFDVIVHDGGIIDLCGDDGHMRSTDGGVTWTTATSQPLNGGRCSITVSPDESYVLFAVVGTTVFESDNGGQSWPVNYTTPERRAQGRIPFVATNQRAGAAFDLWFGDIGLWRATCTTPSPAAAGGTQRCAAVTAWTGSLTRPNGGHDDVGDIAFVPGVAVDACPSHFSSDGGVYRNTSTTSPACHTPAWAQPTVTPHALWNYSFSGVSRPGAATEHLYLGNQDTGTFGALNGGATAVTWTNERCCDGFDATGDGTRALTTVCCCIPPVTPGGPGCTSASGDITQLFVSGPGLVGTSTEVGTPSDPPGNMKRFEQLESILNFGPDDYIVATDAGVFVTLNIGASPIVWTPLGAASVPAAACGLQAVTVAATTTFFVKSSGCDGDQPGTLWRYQGTAAGGTWQQVPTPGVGSFGVYAVDPGDPQRLIASHLGGPAGPRMVITHNGGTIWNPLPALDALMTGAGTFRYLNQTGPAAAAQFNGYPQPTLVAFDPADPDLVVAGGADSGVFISTNGGTRWQLVTDPVSPGTSAIPHIPRPFFAHFDHDPPAGDINLYLGTRGRGAWRLTFTKVAMPEIQVPAPPFFAPACAGSKATATLNVCNTSAGNLAVSGITSSSPDFTVLAPSAGFPVNISHDFCFPFQIGFNPSSPGPKSANLTIASNDPNFPSLVVAATGSVGAPTAATVIADTGNFGEVCASSKFQDLPLTISNSGVCSLTVTAISSSSGEFQMAQVLNFPLTVAPGDTLTVPLRFQPTSPGAKSGTLTVSTNDPLAPTKTVSVSGTAPPGYVCEPPVFAALDAGVGPTFGSAATGDYTVNAAGRYLASFGERRTFGIQTQGEYMFYSGRQEGQFDGALLYRRDVFQFGGGFSAKIANLRSEASAGVVNHAAVTFDWLMPAMRVGLFGAKGLREKDVVTRSETVGAAGPLGQPVVATEQLLHTIDQLGGSIQLPLAPNWWVDGNLVYLHRYAPGLSNTAGGGIRLSGLVATNVAFTAAFDVNESFIGSNAVSIFTFGVTLGRWPRPSDYSNPANPLGTLLPRIRYERLERIR